jgi:hypothetical protein
MHRYPTLAFGLLHLPNLHSLLLLLPVLLLLLLLTIPLRIRRRNDLA